MRIPRFNRFVTLSFVSILALALVMGLVLSSLLTRAMSQWEWENTAVLVRHHLDADGIEALFRAPAGPQSRKLWEQTLSHLFEGLPDQIARYKVWDRDATVIWSDKRELIGKRFPDNPELSAALAGNTSVEIKKTSKSENVYEHDPFGVLAEVYVPVFAPKTGEVLGVIEVYKVPSRLFAMIRRGRLLIWTISLAGGLTIFSTLLPLVRQVYRREVQEQTLQAYAQGLEQEVRALVNNVADGIITIEEGGRVKSFNRAAERIFGYRAAEVVDRPATILIPEFASGGPQAAMNDDSHADRNPILISRREMIGRRKDGSNFQMELALSQMDGNQRRTLIGIMHDITERKILEGQLAQSQKMEAIGQLAAGIAHEINTPTQYVGDNIRFLQDSFTDLGKSLEKHSALLQACKEGNPPGTLIREAEATAAETDIEYLIAEVPQAIQQSLEGVERISTIVRAMKDFSHPDTEEKIPTDLNKAIESTITVARNEWKYVARMVTDFDPSLPAVPCLPGKINQVILNLIMNAVHAITDVVGDGGQGQGIITVSTRRDGEWAEIRVADTGTGIPEAIRNRIFDPFFTTKKIGKGTGQGLALSHVVVVEKHGGAITFESEQGGGTTFFIRLPLNNSLP